MYYSLENPWNFTDLFFDFSIFQNLADNPYKESVFDKMIETGLNNPGPL